MRTESPARVDTCLEPDPAVAPERVRSTFGGGSGEGESGGGVSSGGCRGGRDALDGGGSGGVGTGVGGGSWAVGSGGDRSSQDTDSISL